MYLIVGLGNPGKKYALTRHNAGAYALEKIAPPLKKNPSLEALFSQKGELLFLFPQTYMNLSGRSVKKALKKFCIPPQNLIVLHDEVELPPGEIRYKYSGGHRGHNGLRNIIEEIKTRDFHRIRIGVGKSQEKPLREYLLEPYPQLGNLISIEKIQKILADILSKKKI